MVTVKPHHDNRLWKAAAMVSLLLGSGALAAFSQTKATGNSAARSGSEAPRSIWDGVYTEAQAARGQKIYGERCSGCHRDDLSGGDDNEPALKGANFMAAWDGRSVAALFDFIATNMPKNSPGALPLDACIDLVSLVLKANDVPPGKAELPTNIDALDRIRLTAKPPGR